MENYFQPKFDIRQVNAISNLGLAHIGDGVYELLCRTYLCIGGDQTVLKLHKDTVALVKAPTQAAFADKIKPHLTEEELAWFKRGRNNHTMSKPKNATAADYRKATGLEVMFAYLYLTEQQERMHELFSIGFENKDN